MILQALILLIVVPIITVSLLALRAAINACMIMLIIHVILPLTDICLPMDWYEAFILGLAAIFLRLVFIDLNSLRGKKWN